MNGEPLRQLAEAEPPKGWIIAGSQPQHYQIALDRETFHSGTASGSIRSIADPSTDGFGTLMQQAIPDKFAGHRVRLSAWLKTKDVNDWAGFWFRVDGPSRKMLGFDNMMNRPLKGTLDWAKHEIVLNVPNEAVNIAYGVLISGTGQAWVDDIVFEIVSEEVPVTNMEEATEANPPTNLDFEE
jgi:hypothetical protein